MRLLVDITAHGLGHLAQTAPIVAALRERLGSLDLVAHSGITGDVLRARLGPGIAHYATDAGFGLVMESPFAVDRAATLERYEGLHARLEEEIERVAAIIREERCGAVLANMGYVALAAAERAGVPGIGVCSLTWSEVFAHYCGAEPGTGRLGAARIVEEMEACYRSAGLLLRLDPGLPMRGLGSVSVERPIAQVGKDRRDALRERFGGRPVVLCAFAGLVPEEAPPVAREPEGLGVIGPAAWAPTCPDLVGVDELGLSFHDLIASADLVLSKPGYGIVTELACAGAPALLVSRGDWPEEPFLMDWIARHGRAAGLGSLAEADAGTVREHLAAFAALPPPPRPAAGGEDEAAGLIADFL